MNTTATVYHRDGREKTVDIHEASRLTGAGKDWSFTPPLPAGWDRETARYRVTRDVHPSPNSRHRFETPFSSQSDSDAYQYGERLLIAGEIIETTSWPHPSFWPLNESGRRVHQFFLMRQKSRLPRSPYDSTGKLRLDDGLAGAMPKIGVPHLEPVRLHPGQAFPGL